MLHDPNHVKNERKDGVFILRERERKIFIF